MALEKFRLKKMKKDIQNKIQKKEKIMVLFSATWCPFSRSFLPIFKEYSKTNPNECLNVNSDESPEICKTYSVRYYPTVILFKNGKVQKRLDSKPGIGLSQKQLKDFTDNL